MASNHFPMTMAGALCGSSGTPPGAILMLAFHFLALPAPQCCSQCVGWKQARPASEGDALTHAWHPQRTLSPDMTMTPLMPLHTTGICGDAASWGVGAAGG